MMLRKAAGSARVGVNVMFELLGAVIGGFLGLAGPFFYAQIYIAHGGDPTAAGGVVDRHVSHGSGGSGDRGCAGVCHAAFCAAQETLVKSGTMFRFNCQNSLNGWA